MKAIIKMGNGSKLRLALVSEGANDLTLFSMLTQQYPALQYDGNHLFVPIFEGHMDPDELLPARLEIYSDVIIKDGAGALVSEVYSTRARTIRGGVLVLEDAQCWTIVRIEINGILQWDGKTMVADTTGRRLVEDLTVRDGQVLHDVVAGALVKVDVVRRAGSGDGCFRAVIRAKD